MVVQSRIVDKPRSCSLNYLCYNCYCYLQGQFAAPAMPGVVQPGVSAGPLGPGMPGTQYDGLQGQQMQQMPTQQAGYGVGGLPQQQQPLQQPGLVQGEPMNTD